METTAITSILADAALVTSELVDEPAVIVDQQMVELMDNIHKLNTQTDAMVQDVVRLRQRIKLLELGW